MHFKAFISKHFAILTHFNLCLVCSLFFFLRIAMSIMFLHCSIFAHFNVYFVHDCFHIFHIAMFIMFISVSVFYAFQFLPYSFFYVFLTCFNVYCFFFFHVVSIAMFIVFMNLSTSFLFQCLSLLFILWLTHFHAYHFHWSFDFLPISMPLFFSLSLYFLLISMFIMFIHVSIPHSFPERQHFGRTYIVDVALTSEESAMDVFQFQMFQSEFCGWTCFRWGWANA